MRVIVEVKVNEPAFGRLVVDELRRAGAVDRACVGGFRRGRAPRRARPASRRWPPARRAKRCGCALYRSWLRWPVTHTAYGGYQVPEVSGTTRVVSRRFVADARRAGLGVQVWTVNDEPTARRLLSWGVDALITDRPRPDGAAGA